MQCAPLAATQTTTSAKSCVERRCKPRLPIRGAGRFSSPTRPRWRVRLVLYIMARGLDALRIQKARQFVLNLRDPPIVWREAPDAVGTFVARTIERHVVGIVLPPLLNLQNSPADQE